MKNKVFGEMKRVYSKREYIRGIRKSEKYKEEDRRIQEGNI